MGGFANQNWNLAQCSGQGQIGQSLGFMGSLLGSVAGLGASASYGPDEDGWYDYVENPAPRLSLCQFKHDNILPERIWVGYAYEFRPEFNVAYLKWRLTGIAKESGFNDWSW